MNKRGTKFYRKNEVDVMKKLGLTPSPQSGAGENYKCDGYNEQIICELKSTDKQSFVLKKEELNLLEYHAKVAHKLPVFCVQFLESNEIYLLCKLENITDIAKYIETGEVKKIEEDLMTVVERKIIEKDIVRSSIKSREMLNNEFENKYKKKENKAL